MDREGDMVMPNPDRRLFGATLRRARQQAQFPRIADFAAHLQHMGLAYSISAVQAWETGTRVPDRPTLLTVCEHLANADGFEHLREVVDLFAYAGWIAPTEDEVRTHFPHLSDRDRLNMQLPPRPEYRRLLGREADLADLVAAVTNPQGKPLVVLSGLGGIGKTALAYEVLLDAMRRSAFTRVAWAIAKQEEFVGISTQSLANPATVQGVLAEIASRLGLDEAAASPTPVLQVRLRAALLEQPTLVYVDNLETLAAQDFARILYDLVRDQRQSRVLITSRESLAELPFVFDYPLTGLDERAALDLLHDEAQDRRAGSLLAADPALLQRVYRVTQGMPLALKLIVTQFLLAIPIDHELDRLESTTPEADFYHFLYASIWRKLSDDARTLLLALAGYPGWTLRALLQPLSELSDVVFDQAVAELVRASLVYHSYHVRVSQQMYDMHAMTRWFINGPLAAQWS